MMTEAERLLYFGRSLNSLKTPKVNGCLHVLQCYEWRREAWIINTVFCKLWECAQSDDTNSSLMEFVLDGSPYKESSERKLLPMAKYSNSGPNHKCITLAYTLHKENQNTTHSSRCFLCSARYNLQYVGPIWCITWSLLRGPNAFYHPHY